MIYRRRAASTTEFLASKEASKVKLFRRLVITTFAVAALAVAVSAPAKARAAGPQWTITSAASPTNLWLPSKPIVNEVRQLTVGESGTSYRLFSPAFSGGATGPIADEASAIEVQAAIEAVAGAGNVQVTGGPGDTNPYTITFTGALAGQQISLFALNLNTEEFEFDPNISSIELTPGAPGVPSGTYVITATNTGDAAADGAVEPIMLIDQLPAGLAATQIRGAGFPGSPTGEAFTRGSLECELASLACTYGGLVGVGDQLTISVTVNVAPDLPASLTNHVSVSGGGAPTVSGVDPTTISPAPSGFGVDPATYFTATSDDQAGAHPNFTTSLSLNLAGPGKVAGSIKDVGFDLPAGMVGNPAATPRCSMADVVASNCPLDTALGVAHVSLLALGQESRGTALVYNIAPNLDEPAAFAFVINTFTVRLDTALRPGGVVHVSATDLTEAAIASGSTVTIWGIPADHNGSGPYLADASEPFAEFGEPSGAARVPFFTNPTSCSGSSLSTVMQADAWQAPGAFDADNSPDLGDPNWLTYSAQSPASSGCDFLNFDPSFTLAMNPAFADSPAGTRFDLRIPQNEDPNSFATSELRDATVTLPKEVTLNPASADGLEGCAPAQIDLHSPGRGKCPEASEVATVEIETPLLPKPVLGQLYLGTPECAPCGDADAADGKLLHGYLEAAGFGVVVKVPGSFKVDPVTGQITASFIENPQVPFEDLKLTFKGGDRGSLATPDLCGSYSATADFKPWSAPDSGPDATPGANFQITAGPNGGPCFDSLTQRPLRLGFEAGTISPIAGSYSPFLLRFTRKDGEQELSTIHASLPPGLVAKLAGTEKCSDAQIAAAANRSGHQEESSPSCPLNSRIGTNVAGAGAGSHPYFIKAPIYLSGPYKGASLSIVVITSVLAGPFDLGVVVVRSALYIDPETARVTVKSDPLPQSIAGIPLKLRDDRINIDRPEFTLNPTSCDPFAIGLTVDGSSGAIDSVNQRFQVGACQGLGFAPKLAFKLKGGTARNKFPALSAKVTYPKGGPFANVAKAQVSLPPSEFLEQGHIGTVCTRVVFNEGNAPGEKCPAASIYGHARAVTPLLDEPIEGPVFLRANGGERTLPDLVAALHGEAFNVNLVGFIDSVRKKGSEVSRIRNSFNLVPDAPVSSFTLGLKGGKKGLLVNSTNICKGIHRASVKFVGQNGKVEELQPSMNPQCGGGGKKKRTRHR